MVVAGWIRLLLQCALTRSRVSEATKRGHGLLVRATKPTSTPKAVTHPSTDVAHCHLTSVNRQTVISRNTSSVEARA